MASARAGVQTAIQVNGPINSDPPTNWLDKDSASTWAVGLFVASIIILFFVL